MKKYLLALLFLSEVAIASEDDSSFYLGFDASVGIVRVESATFNPTTTEISAGYYFQRQLAVEMNLLAAVSEDDDLSLEADVSQHAGLTFRFETPEVDRGKLMIFLGYSFTELDLSLNDSDYPGSESFDGMSFGMGAEYRLLRDQNWFLGIKAMRYLDKDNVSFDTMGLGVRYVF